MEKKFTTLCIIFLALLSYQAFGNEPIKLAVYHFTGDRYYYHDYAQSVREAVESGFVNSNRFVIVERTKFDQLSEENQFREINTQDAVRIGQNIGANLVVLGHVAGVATGSERKSHLIVVNGNQYYTEYYGKITINLKIVDVESSQIIVSETLNISKDSRESTASALANVMSHVPNVTRSFINNNFPQEFMVMDITEIDAKRDAVKELKIWAGSNHGIRLGDVVSIYKRSEVKNPYTGETSQNNEFIGNAEIIAVNGGDISTADFMNWRKQGNTLKREIESNPEEIIVYYTGKRR
jgi:hypothetical protein